MTSSKALRFKLVGVLALSLIAVLALGHSADLETTHAAGPGPGMSLNVPNALSCTANECSVDVTQPFLLTISTNPAPSLELGGFATEVVFDLDGLNWNPRPNCLDEVQVQRRDGSGLALCQSFVSRLLLGAAHSVVTELVLPPLAPLNVAAGSTTLLVEMDFRCKTAGSFELVLTAWPGSVFGSLYADVDGITVNVKTVSGPDVDGDTVPNQVADTLTINCQEPPSNPTPDDMPAPTAGTTMSPTSTPGGPTDMSEPPEPTATPGPIGAVVAGIGGIDDDGDLRTGLWLLLVAAAGGLAIFGWGRMSLVRVAAAAPGMIAGQELVASAAARPLRAQHVGHQLPMRQPLRIQVQGVEGFSAFIDALRALSRTPGITKARAVSLEQGDGVFEVTLSATATGQELARTVSATLERPVRIEEKV